MKEYSKLSEKDKLKIWKGVLKVRKLGLGQRRIKEIIKKRFHINISENTISGWIHHGHIPGRNKETWFKPKPKPSKNKLMNLYIKKEMSASAIAKIFNTTPVTVLNWIKNYKIRKRSLKEAMNTSAVKHVLREKKLKKPTKDFKPLTKDKAYILGVLCGDAHIHPYTIRFEIRRDKEFIKNFVDSFEKVYGIKFRYWYYQKRNSFVTYINSEIICKDLMRYGKFGTKRWEVPRAILNCKNHEIIASFLKGFYDSEGYAKKYTISCSSINKRGIMGILKLLSKLGIKGHLYKYKKSNSETYYYILHIYGRENIEKFRNFINFTISRKRRNLENIVKK
jgi:intein-encoded DNA endonuclease-like protein